MNGSTISKQALLITAQEIGVTVRQFERWRKAGLLPKPCELRRLGRGKGTEAIYPASAAPQLHAIAKAQVCDGRLDFIGFRLWLAGFPVEPSIFGKMLLRLNSKSLPSAKPRNKRQQIDKLLESFETGSNRLTDSNLVGAREAILTLATGGTFDFGLLEPFFDVVFSKRDSVEGFDKAVVDPLMLAANTKVLSSGSLQGSVSKLNREELIQLRGDLYSLCQTFGRFLGFEPIPQGPEQALTEPINIRQAAQMSLIILHLRKANQIDDKVFEAGPF